MSGSSEDRSQPATARHLQRAREQGNVPLSRDLASLASLVAGLGVLILAGPYLAGRMAVGLRGYFYWVGDGGIGARVALVHAAVVLAQTAGPLVVGAMLAGVAATWLQTGFLFHWGAAGFDLTRLSPARGLARIFSSNHLVELLKSVVKIAALGLAAYQVLGAEVPALGGALVWAPRDFLARLLRDVTRIVLAMIFAQCVIVAGDFWWVRLKHARDLRMSREDVRQEHKEMEGDPHIKAKRKRIRFIRLRRRMMAAVPAATVVVTNPSHYAVALAYERGKQSAPKVVAKGVDEVAANIRAVAEQHKVPLVRNPPLARALYLVELDAEIPAEHFQAAAEIIAYVWRLKTAFKAGAG